MKLKIFTLTFFLVFSAFQNIDAQIVINEYCSSSTSFLDEYGDDADWIELFNTSSSAVDLSGWHLSDKADNLAKWTFPSIKLPAGGYLQVFASGKDLYEYSQGDSIYYSPLVEATDIFAYTIGSDSVASNWYLTDYDDSEWPKGKGGFGYGSSYAATTVPDGTISVFVRKTFNITGLASVKELLLDLDYDDGFVVYINGKEVARENLGSVGDITPYNELTPNYLNPLLQNGSTMAHFDLSRHLDCLVAGDNVLAIQIHNISNTSSDLLLYPFLTVGTTIKQETVVSELLDLQPKCNNKFLHTNFNISADGEAVFLTNPSGKIVHQTDSTPVPNDVSCGLTPDGSGEWKFFADPTPGRTNNTKSFASARTNEITFSIPGGLQTSAQTLTMRSKAGTPIYYTTDGTVPTKESTLYNGALSISKTTIIRAISYCDTLLPGQPSTRSFIFPGRKISLPVFSLTTDPYNLYDYNYGIYVEGPNAEAEDPHYGANYWQDWERPVHVEYFLPDGQNVIDQDAGIKIAGAYTRMSSQKTFALHARKSYGKSHFNYKFFHDKDISAFKAINLRNSGNDFGSTHFRDAMITNLVRNNNIDIQAYLPTVVYLNGEYWGILNLRERLNENYLEENFSYVDAEKVDYIKGQNEVKEGSYDHYQAMLDFIASNSLANDDNYEYLKTQMDIDEYIEYMVSEMYCNNQDWPGNNIKYWRPQSADGRWRWMLFDTDFGYAIWHDEDYSYNMVSFCLAENSSDYANAPWATFLLRNLVENENFRSEFLNRFCDRMNCEFMPSVVNALIDSLDANIATEISYHNNKWGHGTNYRNERIKAMRNFANMRPSNMRTHIRSRFPVGSDVNVTVDVNDPQAGYVRLNSLKITEFPWTGIYFSKNPIIVRAVARPGYRFVKWQETGSIFPEIRLAVGSATTFTAVFEPDDSEFNSVVINEINFKSNDSQDTKDWVELYNTTAADIDISGWKLTDENFDMPFVMPRGTVIPAYGYIVVCSNKDKLLKYWPNLTNTIGNFDFGIGKSDAVRLYDDRDNMVDCVTYRSKSPWPTEPNGEGNTLSLTDPFSDNMQAESWRSSVLYGTPGTQNDNFSTSYDFLITDCVGTEECMQSVFAMCRPNPVAGNAAIEWVQPCGGNVRIDLFNTQGQKLAQLCNEHYSQGEHEIDFSGIASGWNSGVYFVRVFVDGCVPVVIKLVKR